MIRIISNADALTKKWIFEDSFIAYYYSVCESFAKGYVNKFITDMQILITKVGIIVGKVSIPVVKIAYCRQSIRFLCDNVLDNPDLIKTFNEIELNDKGNKNKHAIGKNVNIDMSRCVNAYNNLINRIADKYGLRSLEKLIVRKAVSDNQKNKQNVNNTVRPTIASKNDGNTSSRPAPIAKNTRKTPSRPVDTATNVDNNLKLKATLEKGDGRYKKGLFNKQQMINFLLTISIENQNDLRIKKISAHIKGKHDSFVKKLPLSLESTTSFDLPVDSYGGDIEATVEVEYKIGVFKSKEIKVTVSKLF